MSVQKFKEGLKALPDGRFLLRALGGWCMAALVLLPTAALFLSRSSLGSEYLAYISSALSFFTALFAGARAGKSRSSALVPAGITAGLLISILLLSAGALLSGEFPRADGVLSVCSFSLAGCLFGTVFFSGVKKPAKKRKNSKKR